MKYTFVSLFGTWLLCLCWGGLVRCEDESWLWYAVSRLGRLHHGRADWADLDRLPNFGDPNVLLDTFYRMDEAETAARGGLFVLWKDVADFLETEYRFRRWAGKQPIQNGVSDTTCQAPGFSCVMESRVKRENSKSKGYASYLGAILYYFPILHFTIPFSGEVKLLGYDLL